MNDPTQACPTHQELQALLTENLTPTQLACITEHVEACAVCQQALEALVTQLSDSFVSPQDLELARAKTFIAGQSDTPTDPDADDLLKSVQIPGITLDRRIGQGGMGIVFAATQSLPVRRTVAVKLIRSGRATQDFAQRFMRERSLLAGIEHPCVARLYDAGQLENGMPWFLMEFVDGVNIVQFCQQQRVSLPDRLTLFQSVCAAVQHLHNRQIIHRDLKPDNILVTKTDGRPVPKLIDFGLAKLLDSQEETGPDSTTSGTPVGTPRYMSPEQTGYLDTSGEIDTTTDVYSLGVILYELLTGDTPIDGDTANRLDLVEILSRVRELDPIRPSRRVVEDSDSARTHAASLQLTPQQISRELSSDLDWIVLKAIQKNRSERYPTVEAFARDIGHYQENLPVAARPPSTWYHAKKFYRRHRGLVWAAGTLALALCLGVAGTGYGLLEARKAERQANFSASRESEARQKADELRVQERNARLLSESRLQKLRTASRMLQAVFEGFNPELATAGESDLRSFLLQRLKTAASGLAAQEPGESEDVLVLKVSLAKSLSALGEHDSAIPLLENALSEINQLETIGLEDKLTAMSILAMVCMKGGQIPRALELTESAKKKADLAFPEGHPLSLSMRHYLASALAASGDEQAAIALREGLHRLLSPDHPAMTYIYYDSLNSLAVLYNRTNRPAQAAAAYRDCLAYWKPQLPKEHPMLLTLRSNLAIAVTDSGDLPGGVAELREILAVAEQRYPSESQNVGDARINLGVALAKSNEVEEACQLWQQTITSTSSIQTRLRAELELLSARLLLLKSPDVSLSDLRTLTESIAATLGDRHPVTIEAQKLLQDIDTSIPGNKKR